MAETLFDLEYTGDQTKTSGDTLTPTSSTSSMLTLWRIPGMMFFTWMRLREIEGAGAPWRKTAVVTTNLANMVLHPNSQPSGVTHKDSCSPTLVALQNNATFGER